MALVSVDGSVERLIEKNYQLVEHNGFLVLKVPYLNSVGDLCEGTLADPITSAMPGVIGKPSNHQFYFIGEQPCSLDGSPLTMLGGGACQAIIAGDLSASFQFSMKHMDHGVPRDYVDLYEKVALYTSVISGPALAKFEDAQVGPFNLPKSDWASPFVFPDEMSTNAEIEEQNRVFRGQKVAIIGVGGTGSYVLDFLAKCPVDEIRIFDADKFLIKNSYRSPGVPTPSDFGKSKVEVMSVRYEQFHRKIVPYNSKVDAFTTEELDGITFAFICIDYGPSRIEIAGVLRTLEIPFIDTGLGLELGEQGLVGMVRTTYSNTETAGLIIRDSTLPSRDGVDDIYDKNIQLVELNAFNASLAVIRFKQTLGFYKDEMPYYNRLYPVQRGRFFDQYIERIN